MISPNWTCSSVPHNAGKQTQFPTMISYLLKILKIGNRCFTSSPNWTCSSVPHNAGKQTQFTHNGFSFFTSTGLALRFPTMQVLMVIGKFLILGIAALFFLQTGLALRFPTMQVNRPSSPQWLATYWKFLRLGIAALLLLQTGLALRFPISAGKQTQFPTMVSYILKILKIWCKYIHSGWECWSGHTFFVGKWIFPIHCGEPEMCHLLCYPHCSQITLYVKFVKGFVKINVYYCLNFLKVPLLCG